MWRSVEPPLGSRMQPDVDHLGAPQNADPVLDDDNNIATNEVGDEIWTTNISDYNALINTLSVGECTYAHLGDDVEATRQCVLQIRQNGTRVMGMAPAGKFFYPTGVAVDGTKVYVVDRMNHRVRTIAFESDNVAQMQFPIGNGVPGSGQYSYSNLAGGQSGWQLNSPNGLTVDAAHRLLVADGGNQRIAVFNEDGSLFAAKTIPPAVAGVAPVPTSIAISPGASVNDGNANARIVVLDRYTCSAWIYNSNFNLVPLANGAPNPMGGTCVPGTSGAPLDQWSILTGVAIDASNRIYIADSYNNRVIVLAPNGRILGDIGEPPAGLAPTEQPPVEALETPSSVLIDHLGRLVVNDSDNVRLAFYDVQFPIDPNTGFETPVATFQLEVPAPGDDHEEFPTGLAEQWGTGPGLDPAGRYLKIDTANHRVQRLELADLAIVQEAASYTGDTVGSGRFAVAVPTEKAGTVRDVLVTLTPSVAGVTVSNIRSIKPAATYANPLNISRDNPDTDIVPGSWVQFEFDFTTPFAKIPVTFHVTAVGNRDAAQPDDPRITTEADPVDIDVRGQCVGCDAQHTIYNYPSVTPESPTPATGYLVDNVVWYNKRVFVRLTPTASTPPVKYIEWKVLGTEMPRYGSQTRVTEITEEVPHVDVSFVTADSIIQYWAVTEQPDGGLSVGPVHVVPILIDQDPPTASFSGWPACAASDTSLSSWCREPFSISYTLSDGEGSGVVPHATPQLSFFSEGSNLRQELASVDRVTNAGSAWTSDPASNGRWVNLDMTAPIVTPPQEREFFVNVGEQRTLADWLSAASATDALSGVNATGLEMFQGATPVTAATLFGVGQHVVTFKATDRAGNSASINATVKITAKAGAAAIYTGAVAFNYGDPIVLSGTITATPDVNVSGGATITLRRQSDNVVVGTINDTDIDNPLANPGATDGIVAAAPALTVGAYAVTITYPGTDSVSPASTTATINVVKRVITIKADDKSKVIASVDPALTFAYAPGSLQTVYGHALTGTGGVLAGAITRPGAGTPAGETLGTHAITQGTLAIAAAHQANYALLFIDGVLTIQQTTITIRAYNQFKVYGQVDPPFTYESNAFYCLSPVTGLEVACGTLLGPGVSFSGALTREQANTVAGQGVGSYGIRIGTLSLPAGYQINFNEGLSTFSILRRPVVVRPQAKSKMYGEAVPELTAIITAPAGGTPDNSGLLPGEDIPYSLTTSATVTSPANTSHAISVVLPPNILTLRPNYDIGVDTATLVVTPRPATITANNKSKVYGDINPALDAVVTGIYGEDTLNYSLATTAVTLSDVVPGGYPISVVPGLNPNYIITAVAGRLDITRKPATVIAADATKVYGAADPPIATTTDGFIAGDLITVTGARAGAEVNVGDYPNGTTASVTGADAGNYEVTVVKGTFRITPRPATVIANNKSKIYGDPEPALDAAVSGLVSGDALAYTLSAPVNAGAGVYTGAIVVSLGLNPNYSITATNGTLIVHKRPVTVQASTHVIKIGDAVPTPTYTVTAGSVVNGDTFSGALTIVGLSPAVGVYPIVQGTLTLGANYILTVLEGSLTIKSLNAPPVAVDDAATATGAEPININVLSNDIDPDGDVLTVVSLTQPTTGGTATTSGNLVVFTPTPFFSGVVTFTYTIRDAQQQTATATVTVTIKQATCSLRGFRTQTQGGWGAAPTGGNAASLLHNSFAQVFPTGIRIGGINTLTFTSAASIERFLPAGGTAGVLSSSATDPLLSTGGVFAGQVLALQISVGFSDAGVTKRGLGQLMYQGRSVNDILAMANTVLGGNVAALSQWGWSLSKLNDVVDAINNNFIDGTTNAGALTCPVK